MIGLTGGSTDLWGTAHVKSVQLTVVPLTFCTLRIGCLTVDSGSFRIENDEECPFYQFIYYDFHIWPHWYVLFIQWSCFFLTKHRLGLQSSPFLGNHATKFATKPLSALQLWYRWNAWGKVAATTPGTYEGPWVRGDMNKVVDKCWPATSLIFAWWTVATVHSDV